jgi:hypothetical protein
MKSDEDVFLTLRKERYGSISFQNEDSTRIIGTGTIIIRNKDTKEENFMPVEDMKHNILSVIQMCDQVHKLVFDSKK